MDHDQRPSHLQWQTSVVYGNQTPLIAKKMHCSYDYLHWVQITCTSFIFSYAPYIHCSEDSWKGFALELVTNLSPVRKQRVSWLQCHGCNKSYDIAVVHCRPRLRWDEMSERTKVKRVRNKLWFPSLVHFKAWSWPKKGKREGKVDRILLNLTVIPCILSLSTTTYFIIIN